jgi:hypothetical protein
LRNWPCPPMIRLPNVPSASAGMWRSWCRPVVSGRMGLPPVRVDLQHRPVSPPAEGYSFLFLRLRKKMVSKYHLLSDGGVNHRRKMLTY